MLFCSECRPHQKSTQFHQGSCYEKLVNLLKKEELKNWKINVIALMKGKFEGDRAISRI